MKKSITAIVSLAAGLVLITGCASHPQDAKNALRPHCAKAMMSVVPGTITITNPGPPGSTGSGTVLVSWVPSQASLLQGKATWRLKKNNVFTAPTVIQGAKSVPAGAYTIVLSACSVPGYTRPTSSSPVYVSNGNQTTVLVQYTH
jgi:hypothetical protein